MSKSSSLTSLLLLCTCYSAIQSTASASHCCSWDGGTTCGVTTDFCKANQYNCESQCEGSWQQVAHAPTPAPQTIPTASAAYCCSWDGGTTCGVTTDFCKANQYNCESHCEGSWRQVASTAPMPTHAPITPVPTVSTPTHSPVNSVPTSSPNTPVPTTPEPTVSPVTPSTPAPQTIPTNSAAYCCSWDGGATCGVTTDFCKANQYNCEHCEGSWRQVAPTAPMPTHAPITPVPTSSTFKPTPPPVPTAPTATSMFKTSNAWSFVDVMNGLLEHTYKIRDDDSDPMYSLLASGGVASGGVVSESQAYALLATGIMLASWDEHGGTLDRNDVLIAFHGYFNGWKEMCQNSAQTGCQDYDTICEANDGTRSLCLPGWKFSNDLSSEIESNAATDADADGISGMILAVLAVEDDQVKPSWYDEVRAWADQSSTAFMRHDTTDERSGFRLVKLGTCWGGWEGAGQNPSYHSPGSYKLMRDYQHNVYSDAERSGYEAVTVDDWDELIATSYKVVGAVECDGMVPNWARVTTDNNGGLVTEPGSFSGSGTDQNEFGAEAARTVWRLAFDHALYPDDDRSADLLQPMISNLILSSGEDDWKESNLQSCGAIQPVRWWNNMAFTYGPVLSSLIVPSSSLTTTEQQRLIDLAGEKKMNRVLFDDYFHDLWLVLSNLAVGGAISSAATKL